MTMLQVSRTEQVGVLRPLQGHSHGQDPSTSSSVPPLSSPVRCWVWRSAVSL